MDVRLITDYKSVESELHYMGFIVQVEYGAFQIMNQSPTLGGGIEYHKVHSCKTVKELQTWVDNLKKKREDICNE